MTNIDNNPEFGIELVLTVPYAYWLHKNNKLGKVSTSLGMKPFYYFHDDVEEKYDSRTIINEQSGTESLPNSWIYGANDSSKLYKDEWKHWESFSNEPSIGGCGILDYRKWEVPDYSNHFKNDDIVFDKPVVVISNRFNFEHGGPPVCYFDIQSLYEMFNYLTEAGYTVIYKRPNNKEFPIDQNEMNTLQNQGELTADVEGIGKISDYQLTEYYDDVHLIDDIVSKYPQYTYNEVQLKLFANTSYFIGMGGGSSLLTCLFKKPTLAYYGRKMIESKRKNFWYDKDGNKNIKNYHWMINSELIPFVDEYGAEMENGYSNFLREVKRMIRKTNNIQPEISTVGMEDAESLLAEKYIKGKDKVLEWGSGGTTLYFPYVVNKFVSIEHDIEWHRKLEFEVNDNVEFYHVPIGNAKLDSILDPHAHSAHLQAGDTTIQDGITYWPTRERYDWHCGVDYIKKPLELPYRDYDIVLVDGRCRSMCAYMATHLLKEDGYLLFHDFAPRKYYHGILKYYDIVERQDTLLVLSMKKEEDWLSDEETIEISENLYNTWSKETGRIR